jgi:tape measure domain-containing protein
MAATDIERLIVALEARTVAFERALDRANGVANRRATAIERRFQQMNQNLDGVFSRMTKGLMASVSGIGAALGVREIAALADTWTELTGRVDLAAGSMEKGQEVMSRLAEMARRTYSGLEQTAESYLANAKTLSELGYSTQTQLDYTEALNNALVISAAKGDRAASVMGALSKAMASGKLSGDNLNTVIESGGRVAEALAASMGVTTLELRKLGSDGKITRTELIGITSELEKLREEADGMQATLGDAFTLLRNAALQYVGAGDQAIGVSRQLADAVILVADNFDLVADAGVKLGFVIASALIGRALGGMLMVIPNAVAAMISLVSAFSSGTIAAAGFSAALGPIGLAAGALAAAIYLLHDSQTDAEHAADAHEASLRLLKAEIENVDYANGEAVASTRTKIAADIDAAKVALARAKAERELAAAILQQEISPSMSLLPAPEASDVANTVENSPAVKDRQALIDTIERQIDDLQKAQTTFEEYAGGKKKPVREIDRPVNIDVGGSGKKGRQRQNDFERQVQQVKDRTAALQAETAAQAALNPLINDYDYAITKAKATQELLNAAQKAGLEITPALRANIDQLAEGYAKATAEGIRLAKTQEEMKRRSEEMRSSFKDVVSGFISDLRNGRSGAEALANSLSKVLDKVIEIGLNSIFGTGGSGGGILGGLFNLFFHARGGVAAHGKPQPLKTFARGGVSRSAAIFGEAGPEAAVPLPDGRRIPVDLRGPKAGARDAQSMHITVGVSADNNGNILPFVESVSEGQVAKAAPRIVSASTQQVVPTMSRYQREKSGGDYRNG